MSEQIILLAAIKRARTMIESGDLPDREAFALQVLCDFADANLNPKRALALDRLQKVFDVRVDSSASIHEV
jgi:hypothetical protein